ncbi:MAG TPA: dTDP-4-amino-4,6-dideoxygalactose transaminase [Candidatus Baltobacteraceae bacterium]|nr:dTDP-4-amino-4,6-dideoxygalactose transaminase [Candidatus Baltobacteraceae bacterium]
MKIPFNRPVTMGNEQRYMTDAIARMHISGDGHYTKLVHRCLEEIMGGGRALMTTSCTHAIEMCALLLDIAPGDEVIMPSFTFVSTANAFVLRGARPVFVDIRADTLNIDEALIEEAITKRTRAIVVVHYAGVACQMDAILDIARRHGLAVIEDNAHGLFGAYKGRPLGSLGVFATLSFHETKNVSCGEGGALIINDPGYGERAEIVREKGTNRSRYFRGLVDKYSWVGPGSSYLPSDLLAAYLYGQLEASGEIQRRRQSIWDRYHSGLQSWAERNGVGRPNVPGECQPAYHLYYLLLPSPRVRDALIDMLRSNDIEAVFHYVPLHVSEYGKALGYRAGQLPVTESAGASLVRLPMYNDMTVEEQDRVVEAIRMFRPRVAENV